MAMPWKILSSLRHLSSLNITPNVCIVGAGPAGFYAAQQILKSTKNAKVDILEKFPVPYGLVRYGVAPDHPEVKNVINTFEKIARDTRVNFLGNVHVGKDISIEELKQHYHAILLSYGAEQDRVLNIPGEKLKNVFSARTIVGWYNGVPDNKDLKVDLSGEDVVIIGQGNVAIDVARILLSPVDKLRSTDITSYALEQLSKSNVRRVWLVGRRGPLQAAFTIAELREMLKLENCKTLWRIQDFKGIKEYIPNLARPRKRLTELMLKSVEEMPSDSRRGVKEFRPIFLRGPVELLGSSSSVERLKLSVNELQGDDMLTQKAVETDDSEVLPCDIAIRSIGYKSTPIDNNVPFDCNNGKILNSSGKIDENLYAAGWVATGPVGVILSTMTNAFKVGQRVSTELKLESEKEGCIELTRLLKQRNVNVVSYEGWEKIDKVERERGKILGKPREKIVDLCEMLQIGLN